MNTGSLYKLSITITEDEVSEESSNTKLLIGLEVGAPVIIILNCTDSGRTFEDDLNRLVILTNRHNVSLSGVNYLLLVGFINHRLRKNNYVMTLIITKPTIGPETILHIIRNPIGLRKHLRSEFKGAVDRSLAISISNSKKLVHSGLIKASYLSTIMSRKCSNDSRKSLGNLTVNELVHTFHNKTG